MAFDLCEVFSGPSIYCSFLEEKHCLSSSIMDTFADSKL